MDEKAQSDGEKRVQAVLIAPLEALGLARPSKATLASWAQQKRELQQGLAYMSEGGLAAVRDWVKDHPAGKEGDRFPIALTILKEGFKREAPETGPSPLMLNIFAHETGQEAIRKGWAPELLKYIRAAREWPGSYSLSKIKSKADDPMRRLEDIELRMSRNEQIPPDELAFRDRRLAALRQCQDIADQAGGRGAV